MRKFLRAHNVPSVVDPRTLGRIRPGLGDPAPYCDCSAPSLISNNFVTLLVSAIYLRILCTDFCGRPPAPDNRENELDSNLLSFRKFGSSPVSQRLVQKEEARKTTAATTTATTTTTIPPTTTARPYDVTPFDLLRSSILDSTALKLEDLKTEAPPYLNEIDFEKFTIDLRRGRPSSRRDTAAEEEQDRLDALELQSKRIKKSKGNPLRRRSRHPSGSSASTREERRKSLPPWNLFSSSSSSSFSSRV